MASYLSHNCHTQNLERYPCTFWETIKRIMRNKSNCRKDNMTLKHSGHESSVYWTQFVILKENILSKEAIKCVTNKFQLNRTTWRCGSLVLQALVSRLCDINHLILSYNMSSIRKLLRTCDTLCCKKSPNETITCLLFERWTTPLGYRPHQP